jgi:dynein heavy chain
MHALVAGKPRHEWVLEWPGMVVLVVTGIFWTRAVEAALGQGPKGVKACEESCTQELMKVCGCGK